MRNNYIPHHSVHEIMVVYKDEHLKERFILDIGGNQARTRRRTTTTTTAAAAAAASAAAVCVWVRVCVCVCVCMYVVITALSLVGLTSALLVLW
jgi:hypothetical protein